MVSFSAARAQETLSSAALKIWGAAMGLLGVAFWLLTWRGFAHDVVTFIAPNILALVVATLCLRSYAKFFHVRFPTKTALGTVALFSGGIIASYFLERYAVLLTSLGIGIILLRCSVMIYRHANLRASLSSALSFTATSLLVLVFLMRVAIAASGSTDTALYSASNFSAAFYAVLSVAMVFMPAGLVLMSNEKSSKNILSRSRTDGLTGMYTRAAFFELASKVICDRPDTRYAMVMVDIDHFKKINDNFGHACGDAALAHAARLIRQAFRSTDLVGRYGGEEFCVFLEGCDEKEVARLVTSLIESARSNGIRSDGGDDVAFTFSAGYAWSEQQREKRRALDTTAAENVAALLDHADKALYRAKNNGRNMALPFLPTGV